MCGRYTLRRINLIRAALDAIPTIPFEEFSERGRFNIAPSQLVPLVRLDRAGRRVVGLAQWGLIPSWAKALPKIRPINARAETLTGSRMFAPAYQRRRCLIPADGFYEWKPQGKGPKQPYFFRFADDRPFAFAGLWERWHPEEGAEPVETCTIITTAANDVVRPVHDRMPVIVRQPDFARWLDRETPAPAVADVLKPHPPDEMDAHPVSTRVNRPANDTPDLCEREDCNSD